ncbi:MAG: hypothetical protein LBM99_04345 [Bacillales bacterium]|jgi:hypothetical protein|nr:hypothetical protein [Bacillales bacterium]
MKKYLSLSLLFMLLGCTTPAMSYVYNENYVFGLNLANAKVYAGLRDLEINYSSYTEIANMNIEQANAYSFLDDFNVKDNPNNQYIYYVVEGNLNNNDEDNLETVLKIKIYYAPNDYDQEKVLTNNSLLSDILIGENLQFIYKLNNVHKISYDYYNDLGKHSDYLEYNGNSEAYFNFSETHWGVFELPQNKLMDELKPNMYQPTVWDYFYRIILAVIIIIAFVIVGILLFGSKQLRFKKRL